MSAVKQVLNRMIDEMPDEIVPDVISYVAFIQKNNTVINQLERASISSMDFWDNPIDDAVWNNV